MAQTFNTSISFVQSTSRKDRRKGAGSLSVSAVAGGGVGSVADSATQAWVRNNFVDKTTEQEISAPKIFSQGIKIGDIAFYKHPDGYVYLDETLVLKGGVVMYGNGSGVKVPSIFESLPIDNYTIKRDGNGALYVDETALKISGGGGGGGVADSVYWNNVIGKPSWIGSTKPSYKYSEIEEKPDLSVYAKTTDIPSLAGYATQTWVEGKGYLLASTASSTYQSKITSSNKLAYSLISGTPTIPTKLSQLTDDVVAGKYLSINGGTVDGNLKINSVGTQSYITYEKNHTALGYLGFDGKNNPVYIPSEANVISSLLHANNFSNYALPITGGKVDGSITANSFIGNLTGNADSATKLATARTIWGQSFDGTKDITGAMTVDGDATFSSKVVIGGISLRKVDNYLYLDSSLVLSGGVTMYGDDGTTVKPIWESIPFDRTTIDWVDGKWTVVGGVGSGGGISEEFLNAKLQGYQPLLSATNKLPYSLISGAPDLSVYFLASNFTKANIKSTLGISDWALASGVPAIKKEHLTNLDSATSWTAFYSSFQPSNRPNDGGNYLNGITLGSDDIGGDYLVQLGLNYFGTPFTRYCVDRVWRDWKQIAFTTDIPTKLSQLTDDVVSGKYLSINGGTVDGNLKINSVGTQSYITYEKNRTALGYLGFDGKNNPVYIPSEANVIYSLLHANNFSNYALPITGGKVDGSITANSFIGNLTGNADSATKLATARTIWGQSFDGTGNIDGEIRSTNTSNDAGLKAYGAVGSIFFGVGSSGTNRGIYDLTNDHWMLIRDESTNIYFPNGNIAIGSTIADAKLHVHGTAKFTGDTTFASKVVIGTIPVYESADGTLFVDANVVFRGGVAMYGNTTTTINEE